MLNLLKEIGFTIIFLRFIWWIASSLTIQDKQWMRVFLGQATEGLLLFFFYAQLFGNKHILIMHVIFTQWIGFFLVCFGVGLAFIAKHQLGTTWVYASAYKVVPKQSLLTTGAYRFVRHPIYTGIFLSYVGIELLAGSWLWVSMIFLLIPFFRQAKKEEEMLIKHFGQKYKTYQSRTKMLIPFVL